MSKIKFGYFLVFLNFLFMFQIGNLSISKATLGVFDIYVFLKGAIQLITLVFLIFQGALKALYYNLLKNKRYILVLFYFLVSAYSSIFVSNSFKSLYFSFTILYSLLVISWVITNLPVKISNESWLQLIYIKLYKVIIISLILSLIIFPSESLRINYDSRLQSIILYVGSNGLAWFLFCFAIYTFLKKQKITFGIIILLLLIFATQSRTTIVLIILFCILLVIRSRKIILLNFFLLLFASVIFVFDFNLIENFTVFFTRGETQIESLSGRTFMWSHAFDLWLSNPYTGHGVWIGPYKALLGTAHEGISQLHNSYIEVLVSSGIIGFLSWVSFLFINWFKSIGNIYNYVIKREKHSLLFIWSSTIMLFLPLKMYTSSEAIYFDHSMILLLLISYEIFKEKKSNITKINN